MTNLTLVDNGLSLVASAAAAYRQKEADLDLVIASMGKDRELYPDTQRRADEIEDELIEDARKLGKMVARMDIWRIGGEL